MNNIEGMEEMYLDLIQPSSLIELFENTEEFRDWLRMGTREEMGWALKAFERDELYSYCKIIKEEMKISS
jgi:hypothetical protein|tara:strand:- start:774 stop:983 length:210 start_codon:yes stop_codon:yes gene_type:complete